MTVPMLRLTAGCTLSVAGHRHLLLLGWVVLGLELDSTNGLPRLSNGRARACAGERRGGRAGERGDGLHAEAARPGRLCRCLHVPATYLMRVTLHHNNPTLCRYVCIKPFCLVGVQIRWLETP